MPAACCMLHSRSRQEGVHNARCLACNSYNVWTRATQVRAPDGWPHKPFTTWTALGMDTGQCIDREATRSRAGRLRARSMPGRVKPTPSPTASRCTVPYWQSGCGWWVIDCSELCAQQIVDMLGRPRREARAGLDMDIPDACNLTQRHGVGAGLEAKLESMHTARIAAVTPPGSSSKDYRRGQPPRETKT
jgi:hypothetical protein